MRPKVGVFAAPFRAHAPRKDDVCPFLDHSRSNQGALQAGRLTQTQKEGGNMRQSKAY